MTLGVLALDFSKYMRDDAMAALNLSDETQRLLPGDRGHERGAASSAARSATTTHGNRRHGPAPDDQRPDETGDEDPMAPLPPGRRADWHAGTPGRAAAASSACGCPARTARSRCNPELTPESRARLLRPRPLRRDEPRPRRQPDDRRRPATPTQQIREIVDSIIDWRDCDDEDRAERRRRTSTTCGLARPHIAAKNGFFDSPEELLQVRGVTPDIFYGHDDVPGLVGRVLAVPAAARRSASTRRRSRCRCVRALLPAMTLETTADRARRARRRSRRAMKLRIAAELEAAIPASASGC